MAEMYNPVTVLFAEICSFSEICEHVSPKETVEILNVIYTTFDDITTRHEVYKVETVGEVYMAVSGCPIRITNHAHVASCCALDMIQSMTTLRIRLAEIFNDDKKYLFDVADNRSPTVDAHIGLNTGRINAGVVGTNNPRFKLFGDTVNMASRMESTCPSGKIQLSQRTYFFIKNNFNIEERGLVEVKGKGKQLTYFLIDFLPGAPHRVDSILTRSIHGGGEDGFDGNDYGVSSSDAAAAAAAVAAPAALAAAAAAAAAATSSNALSSSGVKVEVKVKVNTEAKDVVEQAAAGRKSRQRRRTFWETEIMAAGPRSSLRSWANRARSRCQTERSKWARSTSPTSSGPSKHLSGGVGPPLHGMLQVIIFFFFFCTSFLFFGIIFFELFFDSTHTTDVHFFFFLFRLPASWSSHESRKRWKWWKWWKW